MNDDQLLRYSRHILLPQIGIEGQHKLRQAHVLIIGMGGLGSPAALYLAASGVGTLTLCDHDRVDLTNLQRQIAHRSDAIGRDKTASARETLCAVNPEVNIVTHQQRAEGEALRQWVRRADVVLDASDNFATRYAINRACAEFNKPLVSGAAVRFDGQVAVFDLRRSDSPCYQCLFPEQAEAEEERCAVMGVFAPLTGIVGAMQAAEALKLLLEAGETLRGRLLLLDALSMQSRTIKLKKDPACAVCGIPVAAEQ